VQLYPRVVRYSNKTSPTLGELVQSTQPTKSRGGCGTLPDILDGEIVSLDGHAAPSLPHGGVSIGLWKGLWGLWVVTKRKDSRYVSIRTRSWLKIPNYSQAGGREELFQGWRVCSEMI
jgi:hypothetical protein